MVPSKGGRNGPSLSTVEAAISTESTAPHQDSASNQAAEPTRDQAVRHQDPSFRAVEVHRVAQQHYRATSAIKGTDETGGSRLRDVELDFRVRYPDDEGGRTGSAMVERLVRLSHDKECTVSRTVDQPTSVVSCVVQG